MVRRMKGIARILWCTALALALLPAARAELKWREDTPAMTTLKQYTEQVNRVLTEKGESPINSIFSNYPSETVMGITILDDAEIPESVEITVRMYYDTMNSLQLRVSETDRFPVIAAAILQALYGEAMTWEDALSIPADRAARAKENPTVSFEEPVEELNGTVPRVYYAYEPDPYHNGVSWMQMTLIFPLAGEWDGNGLIVGSEKETGGTFKVSEEDGDPDYEGYYSRDEYSHLEVFATATPEPDSAAAEYDFR